MVIVISTETTEFESDDVRPEFRTIDPSKQGWGIDLNFNFSILGMDNMPMRLPYRNFNEASLNATYDPKENNGTMILIDIPTLAVWFQSNDSAGVWVRKT